MGSAATSRDDGVKGAGYGPIQCLRTDRLELVPLFPPSPPASVLQTGAVGNCVLLPSHALPGAPDVLLAPLVREVVDLTGREGRDVGIIGGRGISSD